MNIEKILGKLRKGDVVIAKHRALPLFTHYIVYTGIDGMGQHTFVGNLMFKGVQTLNYDELNRLLETYRPVSIRQLKGSATDRMEAESRAYAVLGKGYDLFSFNCEHFANYVQTGKVRSSQVRNATAITVIAIAAFLAVRK